MRTSINIAFGRGQSHEQRVAWPILQTTAKAWLVQTPAGDIWLPSYRWDHMPEGSGSTYDERKLNSVLDFLRNITSTNNDALVAVRCAGKGPSDLSVKVGFTVVVRGMDGSGVVDQRQRTATIPISQLKIFGDECSVPRWVLARKLKPNEGFRERPQWPGLAILQDQLRAAFDAAMSGEAAEKAERLKAGERAAQERAERERVEAEAKSVRQAMVSEDGELALAFARKKLTLDELRDLGCWLQGWPRWIPGQQTDDSLERTLANIVRAVRGHPEFVAWRAKNVQRVGDLLKPAASLPSRQPDPVIECCIVEWCEYVGPAKSLRRIDHRDEGCTVSVFGKKHEIEFADGRVVVKMAGPNLKIIEPARVEARA